MKQQLNVLDKYNVSVNVEDKSRQLFNNINYPNKYLKTEVNFFRSIHDANFETASTYL